MDDSSNTFAATIEAVGPLQDLFLDTALASLRLLVAFTLLPPTGEQFMQGYVRAGVVTIIGAYVAFGLPPYTASHIGVLEWIVYAAKETMIGMLIGYGSAAVFWVAQGVGAMADTLSGFNSVQLNNPLSGEESTPVSDLLLQLVVALFFQLGGMLVFIGVIFDSFHVWPLLSALPALSKAPDLFVISQTDSMLENIVKFAAPLMLVLVLIDLGFGLMTRTADKLEPSGLSQPVRGVVTLLMLALLVGVLLSQVRHLLLPRGLLEQLRTSLGT